MDQRFWLIYGLLQDMASGQKKEMSAVRGCQLCVHITRSTFFSGPSSHHVVVLAVFPLPVSRPSLWSMAFMLEAGDKRLASKSMLKYCF